MQYNKVVGTGGIGTGMLFISDKLETFARSESRMVFLSDAKDYCKQQIVLHYTSVLTKGQAQVIPIGCVGVDSIGEMLLREMQDDGMDTRFIKRSKKNPTTISICVQYPDKEGFNFTARNSASEEVTVEYVLKSLKQLDIDSQTILAIIPEVPIESRYQMLCYGQKMGAFNAITIPVSEAEYFLNRGALKLVDLLAVNREEAEALSGITGDGQSVSEALYNKIRKQNSGAALIVTDGEEGIFTFCANSFEKVNPLPVKVINTTGAGDACLGGVLAGIILGLPLQKGNNDVVFGETPLRSAVELGAVCAGMAIELEDTIAKDINIFKVKEKVDQMGYRRESWPTN